MQRRFFYYIKAGLLFSGLAFVSACSVTPQVASVQTLYDYQIVDSENQRYLNLAQTLAKLADSDVVFLGEFHGHPASHLLQSRLQQGLFALRPQQILSMEQFERDSQPIVNRYLYGELGEAAFMQQARAWNNYSASYRPLVEFAKMQGLEVVASNAPADIVRCVGREGESYLTKLNAQELAWIAQQPFTNDAAYETK
ncbi:MAG: ChaN family lipoprotein [Thiomicrospira sp.]